MKCHEIEDLISDYIEDELSEAEARRVEVHLEECESCLRLKEKIEDMIYSLPTLEEEVPFFLRNRLLYIPESQEIEDLKQSRFGYMKYVAAVVGTFVLLLNLFFFTNIYPAANRVLHGLVANIKAITVETGAFFEKVKDSRGSVLAATFDIGGGDDSDGFFRDFRDNKRNDTDPIDIDKNWDDPMNKTKKSNNIDRDANIRKDNEKNNLHNLTDTSKQNVTKDGGKND